MTSFKFNFGGSSSENISCSDQDTSAPSCHGRKICVEKIHKTIASLASPLIYTTPVIDQPLKYLTAHRLAPLLNSDDIDQSDHRVVAFKTLLTHCIGTDLIPSVYEGGLVAWEGAYDLVNYLAASQMSFKGLNVLELGCGSALPSIYALHRGAKSVSLQDYNSEVIDFITIPSVLLNIDTLCEHHFYCGSWDKLPELLTDMSFDLILTSETIYSVNSQRMLFSAFKRLLSPTGQVLLSAKSYYFGVGGTCGHFEQLVKEDGSLSCEKVHTIDCSVPRVILCLKPKH